MKKLSLVFLISILSVNLHAQTPASVVGKWKIISVNDGVYYNYKTDSSFVTKKLQQSLIGKKDSAMSIEVFSNFARQYADYYFTFNEQLKYEEIKAGKLRVFGTYKINTATQSIDVLYGNGGTQKPAGFKFKFDKQYLILYIKSPMADVFELTLERSQ